MDDVYKILEFLSDVTVGTKKDISPELNEIFPLAKFPINSVDVSNFLDSLKRYTTLNDYTPCRRESPWGFISLNIALTNDGVTELKKEEERKKQLEAHQSAIDVNNSIKETNELVKEGYKSLIETNKSIRDTNTAIVSISNEQAIINRIIADNSTTQTKILSRQKWILWATVAVAACSASIAYLSYRKDAPSNQSQQELKVINKRIDTLKHMSSQRVIDPSIQPKKKK